MAFESFLFVLSTIWEMIEDIYLFVESHFDRQRDFEKIDDFLNFAIVNGIKLLCSAVFIACLTLWTRYSSPLKPCSRRDLEAEIVDSLDTIQRLVTRNSELQDRFEKTLEDRNSTRRDYGLLATEKIILENKLAELQLQPDLQDKCWELESSLDRSQARCLDLETSLARSKRLRRDEDSERKALSTEAKQAKSELEKLKAKMQRDKAIAVTAVPTSLFQLHKEKTLLQATLETQKTKFEAQLAEQSQRIHQQTLDLRSARLDFEDLEAEFEKLTSLELPDETRSAGAEKIEDQEVQNEIKELKISLNSKADEICKYQSQITKLNEAMKAKEDFQKDTELTSLENARDKTNQALQVEASAAAASQRIEELERLLEAKDAAYKDLESKQLENTGHQLAEIARLQSVIGWTNADRATREQDLAESKDQQGKIQELLRAKDAELERINAQSLEEHESQRMQIKALQDTLNVQDNNAMDVDIVPDHICDHSKCVDQANLREGRIASLEASLTGRDIKVGRLESAANEQGMKMEGLNAQLEDQKAAIEKLQRSVETSQCNWSQLRASLQLGEEHDFASIERLVCQWQANSAGQGHTCDHSACERRLLASSNEISELRHIRSSLTAKLEDRDRKMSSLNTESQKASRKANMAAKETKDLLRAKEKELEAEKAGRQKALEAERAIARERFQSSNPLQAEVVGLKKALEEMKADRDRSRAANETYRMQSVKARKAVEEGEGTQREVEKQRDELVKAVGGLQGKVARMVEVEMEGVESGRGASRKRQNEGEEDARTAKILRDQ